MLLNNAGIINLGERNVFLWHRVGFRQTCKFEVMTFIDVLRIEKWVPTKKMLCTADVEKTMVYHNKTSYKSIKCYALDWALTIW